jgi:hypothetical protein
MERKMAERPAYSFEYLAFDSSSQAILAHGPTAADALSDADHIAPDAPIYVLSAGSMGWTIWDRRMNLLNAKQALERHGIAVARGWLLRLLKLG